MEYVYSTSDARNTTGKQPFLHYCEMAKRFLVSRENNVTRFDPCSVEWPVFGRPCLVE